MSTYTSVAISDTTAHPVPKLNTYANSTPIGVVRLDDGAVTVQACDPLHLRQIAEAFTDAAQWLADELDRQAARAMNAEQQPTGGAMCPCGARATFYGSDHDARDEWNQAHEGCETTAVRA